MFDGADAEASGGDEDGRQIGFEAVLGAHGLFVFSLCEDGVNRDARDGQLLRRDAELLHVYPRLFERDEIAFVVMTEPERVYVKVSHDDGLTTVDALLGFEPRDDFRRKKMR